jgi:predicted transcriptional regulator
MSELFNDMLNIEILENLCSGVGVDVNINALSKAFNRHRNTIKIQVDNLFKNNIINEPIYPFIWLYKEYPLLVIARADLPRNESIGEFLENDEHTFGVFYVRDEEYNVVLIEYHKDIYTYGKWKEEIVSKNKIPPRETRYPAHSLFFSNNNIIKYQPHSPILLMERLYDDGKEVTINGFRMNHLCFKILKKLMVGEGIRTNENMLAEKLGVNRKTVERHIQVLLREKIVEDPVCRFPKFFVPPDHILVYALMEIKKSKDKIIKAIKSDPHVPIAFDANIGRYNLLLFKVFSNVEEHFQWEERYDNRFTDCLGAMKKLFLSPQNTVSIDQQKVSLGIIREKKELLHGRNLIQSISR